MPASDTVAVMITVQ